MLLRLLFVLLIALNIAVAAWLLLGERGPAAVTATDKGVAELKLLSEKPAPNASVAGASSSPAAASSASANMAPAAAASASTRVASVTSAPAVAKPASVAQPPPATSAPPVVEAVTAPDDKAPVSARRSYRCLALGPFPSQVDLRATRSALASHTVRSRQRQEQTAESHGWRVFLPAQATRELAVTQAKRLEAKGISDYFVVTAEGELKNSVALGLFHDPANARKRRDEVIAAGFPARMSERTETVPVWWLDVMVPDDAANDVRRAVRTPGASARATGCF